MAPTRFGPLLHRSLPPNLASSNQCSCLRFLQEIAGCQSFFRNVDFPTYVRITYAHNVRTGSRESSSEVAWSTVRLFSEPFLLFPCTGLESGH